MNKPEIHSQHEFEVNSESGNGRNVFVRASFERHGEKEFSVETSETGLTEEGREGSRKSGESREKLDAIKGYSSDTDRTKETLDLIVANSPTEKKMLQRIRNELGFVCSDAFATWIMGIKKKVLGDTYKQLPPDELKRLVDKAAVEQIDAYMHLGDKRFDESTYSPVETAATVARRVDLYMRMADRLPAEARVELANTTHDLNIVAFLHEVMLREGEDGKKIRGFDSVNEIGGAPDYNEKFDVDIRTDDEGAKFVVLCFRGKEYEIDMVRLQELVEIAKRLEEEKERKKT